MSSKSPRGSAFQRARCPPPPRHCSQYNSPMASLNQPTNPTTEPHVRPFVVTGIDETFFQTMGRCTVSGLLLNNESCLQTCACAGRSRPGDHNDAERHHFIDKLGLRLHSSVIPALSAWEDGSPSWIPAAHEDSPESLSLPGQCHACPQSI